jgi:hypothetical protein
VDGETVVEEDLSQVPPSLTEIVEEDEASELLTSASARPAGGAAGRTYDVMDIKVNKEKRSMDSINR